MTKKKVFLIVFCSFAVGALLSYFVNSKIFARYNAMNATCTTLNVAVENKMLTTEQVLELGKLTKNKLGDSQAKDYFTINKDLLKNASPYSNCSQFIVGMSQ